MSLQAAIEIQEKEARLHRTLFQKFAAACPLIFLMMFMLGTASTLLSGHPEKRISELELYCFFLFVACVVLFVINYRNQKKISILEIEVLKLKRKQESEK